MKNKVTSYDVAKLAGVSQSSVSRAFSNGKSINAKKRQKILEVAKQLNYRVNYTARSLSSPKSQLVGIIASGLDTPLRAIQIRIITEHLTTQGYHPILLSITDKKASETLIENLLGYNLCGLIATSGGLPHSIIEECQKLQIPVVAMYNDTEISGIDHVTINIKAAGKLAFDMLYSCGVKQMAVIKVDSYSHTLVKRAEYFYQNCVKNDIACEIIACGGNTYAHGKNIAYDIYQNLQHIDGIFCSNDMIAIGVMDGVKKFGVTIPDDIKILGFDDIPVACWDGHNLSTIRLENENTAKSAVDMIIDRINTPDTKNTIYYADLTSVFRGTT